MFDSIFFIRVRLCIQLSLLLNPQENELVLTTSGTTIVFLDISADNINLGRVYIRVLCDTPHGQQFIMLALRTDGPSLKRAKLWIKAYSIQMNFYLTESGSSSDEPLLTTLKSAQNGQFHEYMRGMLFGGPWGRVNSGEFWLITGNTNQCRRPAYFGDVVDGMAVIDAAIEAGNRTGLGYGSKTEIIISESGFILNY
ncbi:unnamed protein product [Meganyctiphanes norvegica]|uniref:PPIase cyclophilin-type domain-containing protein n=1 Tax=Meganyctiphanes norvegica TaxID=48144 RepID=A0AAV2QN59_MEGNR